AYAADGGDEGLRRRVEHAGLEGNEKVRLEAVPVHLARVDDAPADGHAEYVEAEFVPDAETHALCEVLLNADTRQLIRGRIPGPVPGDAAEQRFRFFQPVLVGEVVGA